MTETWKAVPGYVGAYEVSDLGRVRSLPRRNTLGRRLSGRILRQRVCRNGYMRLNLSDKGGTQKTIKVQQLVAGRFWMAATTMLFGI